MTSKGVNIGSLSAWQAELTSSDLSSMVAALLPGSGGQLDESLGTVARNLEGLISASQSQTEAIGGNTQAVTQNTAAQGSGVKGVASTVGKVASGLLSVGMLPVISAIKGLFGGGSSSEPPTLVRYTPPAPIRIDAVNPITANGGWLGQTTRDNGAGQPSDRTTPGVSGADSAIASPQVVVQVQAMDSQSFMDRSSDIARAVREAMLNMHSLNDVVNDL